MKTTFGYILRLTFYLFVIGASVFAYVVSKELTNRMMEINDNYVQVHNDVYASRGYNMLTLEMKEEIANLAGNISVNASIMTDIEWGCMLIMVIVSLGATVLLILDSLKFLKG